MLTDLLRQFSKKVVTIVTGAGALLFMSTAGTSTLLFVGSMATSFDASAINITNASWSESRGRIKLRVDGDDAGRNNTVRVYDADSGDYIDRDRSSRYSPYEWSISDRVRRESSLPCRVRATVDGNSTEADVTPTPSHCGPPPPAAQCADGIDNDDDGLIDFPD